MAEGIDRDREIRQAVEHALASDARLRADKVQVQVEDAVVILSGSVADPGQRARAEQAARGVAGVADVVNSVRVGSAQRGAGRGWDALTGHDYAEASERIEDYLDDREENDTP